MKRAIIALVLGLAAGPTVGAAPSSDQSDPSETIGTVARLIKVCTLPQKDPVMFQECVVMLEMAKQAGQFMAVMASPQVRSLEAKSKHIEDWLSSFVLRPDCKQMPTNAEFVTVLLKRIKARGYSDEQGALSTILNNMVMPSICGGATE